MAKLLATDLWVCEDCLHPLVNGDFTGLDHYYDRADADSRMAEIVKGIEACAGYEGGSWVSQGPTKGEHAPICNWCDGKGTDEDGEECRTCFGKGRKEEADDADTREFSLSSCDCCGTRRAGARHRFAILGK